MRRSIGIAALAISSLLITKSGHADDLGPTPEQVTERTRGVGALWDTFREHAAGLRVRTSQHLLSTAEYQGANTAWVRSEFSFDAGAPVAKRITLGISPTFAWEHLTVNGNDDFDIDPDRGVVRDKRITDFYDSGLRFGTEYRLNEAWSGEFVAGFSARHESGADYSDAVQAGGSLAFSYRRGGWLRLRLGLGIGSDLSDGNVRFSPVYRIQIKPYPGWTLETSGLGGTIEWEPTRKTTLSLGGGLDSTQYRLDRRGRPPGGIGNATLQRRQSSLDLGVQHRFDEHLRIRANFGLVLHEELSLLDEDGLDVDSDQNKDPSGLFRIGFDFRL